MSPVGESSRKRRTVTVAFISDLHANLPALEAVLKDAQSRKVDRVYCLGDVVGYGAWPNEVVALLRRRRIPAIAGNVDRDVLSFEEQRRRFRKRRHPDKYRSLEVTAELLDASARSYLAALPGSRLLAIGSRRVLLVHGSPAGDRDPIMPDAPLAVLRTHLSGVDVLACGHTHLPFVRRVDGGTVVNCGTVGRPGDGDPRACYALVSFGAAVRARILRIPYDVEAAVSAAASLRLPISLREVYRQGVNPWLPAAVLERAGRPPDDGHLASLVANGAMLGSAIERALADDPEGIHDVRVATRRLRAALALLPARVEVGRARKPARRARAMLADLGRALSEPRSLQVRLSLLDDLGAELSERDRLYVETLVLQRRSALDGAISRAKTAMAAFDRARFARFLQRAVVQAAAALGPLPEDPAGPRLGEIRASAERATTTMAETDLHELRIQLKKLRYTLESAQLSESPLRAAAKTAQDVLGEVHDRDELLGELRREEEGLAALGSEHLLAACRRLIERIEADRRELLDGLDLSAFLDAPATVETISA